MTERLGRTTVLSKEEEKIMAQRLILMGEWGFPLTSRDLCYLIKAYLNGQGRTTRFVDNKPGPDFVKGYLKRHPRLAVRTANLIKRSRAELSKKIVDDFFEGMRG